MREGGTWSQAVEGDGEWMEARDIVEVERAGRDHELNEVKEAFGTIC